jgi:glycosyltransferase involved in cell wall biosynthesis
MQVLQLIDTLMYGGAQKLLVAFAQQAQERHIPTTVLSLYDSGGVPVRAELEAYGARVIVLQSRRLLDLQSFQKILQVMRAGNYAIVHTHLTYANINGGLAAKLVGLPVVSTIHNTAVDARHSHPLRNRLEFWTMRYLNQRVLAVGASVAEAYQPILQRELDVIPNAVLPPVRLTPAERFALRTEMAGDPARVICLAIGRFSPQKGYSDLLEAFAHVHLQCPETILTIAGDGSLRSEIESKIAALGLGAHVKLLGLRSDVPRLLAAADIYASASLWEGLPIAHLEAMMAGLPVISTAVGEVPQVVVPGTGLLVPPQKPAELASAVLSLIENPALRAEIGAAACRRVVESYGAPAWFDKILDFYKLAGAKL